MNAEQFGCILESALKYEKSQADIAIISVISILIILLVIYAKTNKRIMRSDKWIIVAIIMVFIVAFAGVCVQSKQFQDNIALDISSKEVVVFEGDFIFDNNKKIYFYRNVFTVDKGEQQRLIYIDSGNIYGTYPEHHILPEGENNGTIIYGKNSKIVLYWSLSANSD